MKNSESLTNSNETLAQHCNFSKMTRKSTGNQFDSSHPSMIHTLNSSSKDQNNHNNFNFSQNRFELSQNSQEELCSAANQKLKKQKTNSALVESANKKNKNEQKKKNMGNNSINQLREQCLENNINNNNNSFCSSNNALSQLSGRDLSPSLQEQPQQQGQAGLAISLSPQNVPAIVNNQNEKFVKAGTHSLDQTGKSQKSVGFKRFQDGSMNIEELRTPKIKNKRSNNSIVAEKLKEEEEDEENKQNGSPLKKISSFLRQKQNHYQQTTKKPKKQDGSPEAQSPTKKKPILNHSVSQELKKLYPKQQELPTGYGFKDYISLQGHFDLKQPPLANNSQFQSQSPRLPNPKNRKSSQNVLLTVDEQFENLLKGRISKSILQKDSFVSENQFHQQTQNKNKMKPFQIDQQIYDEIVNVSINTSTSAVAAAVDCLEIGNSNKNNSLVQQQLQQNNKKPAKLKVKSRKHISFHQQEQPSQQQQHNSIPNSPTKGSLTSISKQNITCKANSTTNGHSFRISQNQQLKYDGSKNPSVSQLEKKKGSLSSLDRPKSSTNLSLNNSLNAKGSTSNKLRGGNNNNNNNNNITNSIKAGISMYFSPVQFEGNETLSGKNQFSSLRQSPKRKSPDFIVHHTTSQNHFSHHHHQNSSTNKPYGQIFKHPLLLEKKAVQKYSNSVKYAQEKNKKDIQNILKNIDRIKQERSLQQAHDFSISPITENENKSFNFQQNSQERIQAPRSQCELYQNHSCSHNNNNNPQTSAVNFSGYASLSTSNNNVNKFPRPKVFHSQKNSVDGNIPLFSSYYNNSDPRQQLHHQQQPQCTVSLQRNKQNSYQMLPSNQEKFGPYKQIKSSPRIRNESNSNASRTQSFITFKILNKSKIAEN